jgi:hypothetical protein
MNLTEWRQKQAGEEFTLPSGLDVKLRKVSMMDLAQRGSIPETIRPAVDEFITRGKDGRIGLSDIQQFGEVIDLVARSCLVEPADLDLAELTWADKQAIFAWANEQAAGLARFRGQSNGAVETAFVVGELPPDAK